MKGGTGKINAGYARRIGAIRCRAHNQYAFSIWTHSHTEGRAINGDLVKDSKIRQIEYRYSAVDIHNQRVLPIRSYSEEAPNWRPIRRAGNVVCNSVVNDLREGIRSIALIVTIYRRDRVISN